MLTPDTLRGAVLIWLCRVQFAGRDWYFSTTPVTPITRAGTSLPHLGGLNPLELQDSITLFSTSPAVRSLGIEVIWPEDIAALIEQGHDLSGATGEISLWVEGADYGDRRVVVAGRITRAEYGADGEPVAFSVEEDTYDDLGRLVPLAARVGTTTWTAPHSDDIGLPYPTVFGRPGTGPNSVGGSPGLRVAITGALVDTLLIAGHTTQAGIAGATVVVVGSDGTTYSTTAAIGRDLLGREVTTASLVGAGSAFRQLAGYTVRWTGGGGHIWSGPSGYIATAGELVTWLCSLTELPVDLERTAAAVGALNGFRVSGYIDDTDVTAWQYLTDNLFPLFPITLTGGSSGLYPVVWRWGAQNLDRVEALVVGRNCDRVSAVSYDRDRAQIINEVTVKFERNAQTGDHTSQITVTGYPDSGDTTQQGSALARKSQDIHGVRATTITTDILWNSAEAAAVAQWILLDRAVSPRRVVVAGSQELAWLEPGQPVLLTDTDLHLSGRRCLVQGLSWDGETVSLDLLILSEEARD